MSLAQGPTGTPSWGREHKSDLCVSGTEKKLRPPAESKGVVIVAVTVCVLLLAVLGATLYYCYKKGRLPCGRSGKQEM